MDQIEINVPAWLKSIDLGQYAATFQDNDIDSDILIDLTAEDLKELDITSLGHRKRLLAAIRSLPQNAEQSTPAASPLAPALSPELYTPTYLAKRILQSRHALEGEIKQVTVLFVDIKDSTQLVAAIGAEEAGRRMYPVLKKMMSAVHRFEGTVNKLQGDGLMAMFGAPLAHEDHAVRACYAALAMHKSIVSEADNEEQDQIQIRIGLNSGEVLVRAINNDLSINYDAIGITANLAARMEQLADPDTIRLTAETVRLAESFIDIESLGPMPVKGIENPVEVYDLKGATSIRTRWQATLARGLSPFVGRESEVETLNRALQQAGDSQGQLVAMVGEAGIGKSRLTYEFTRTVSSQGWQVLEASSVSYGKVTTWLPVIDLLKKYFDIDDNDDPAVMIDKVQSTLSELDEALAQESAALLTLFGINIDHSGWQTLGTIQRRRRSLNALQALFIRESQRQPLLLIFEDLHWIDSETQTLLDELVERLPGNQLLLLVNYRPQYENHWTHKSYHWQLRLDPLVQANIETLLKDSMGDDSSLIELKVTLLERATGSPLFVEESVRTLVESGALVGETGAYQLGRNDADISLPDTIQAIIAERIDRLAPSEKQLLQTASVIGTNVPLFLLQIITEQSFDMLEHGLKILQSAEFLYETQLFPEIEYTFKHAHTHQMAYEGLLQEQRRNIHAQVGTAMQTLYPERQLELVEKLAEHFEKGEVWDQAIKATLLAAEKTKEKYAYEAAIDYARKVLTLADKAADDHNEEKADALALFGDVASLMDDLDAANAHYEQAMLLTRGTAQHRHIGNRMHQRHNTYRKGAKIAYYSHGQGDQILVLVAPLGYVQSTIQPVVETLCQEFRVITYDNLGVGASDPLPEDYTFMDRLEDARAVIQALNSNPVVILGLSQGAALVSRLAWKYPELISKLVLVGAEPDKGNQPDSPFPNPQKESPNTETILRDEISTSEREMATFVKAKIPEPESRDLVEIFIRLFLTVPSNIWRNFRKFDPEIDIKPILAEIKIPTLLMHGTLDEIEQAYYILERIEMAQIYTFENKGHFLMFTAQREFSNVLRHFMLTGEVLK